MLKVVPEESETKKHAVAAVGGSLLDELAWTVPGWVEVGVAWSDGEGGLLWRLAEGSRTSRSGRWWSSLGDSGRPVAVGGAGRSAAVRGDGCGWWVKEGTAGPGPVGSVGASAVSRWRLWRAGPFRAGDWGCGRPGDVVVPWLLWPS